MKDKILCGVFVIINICMWNLTGSSQTVTGIDTVPCRGFLESFDSWSTNPHLQEDEILLKPKDKDTTGTRKKAKIPNGWIVDSRYTIITGYSLFFYDSLREADFGLYSPGAAGTDSALYLRPTDYLEYRDYNNALTTHFKCSEQYEGLSGYFKYEGDQKGDTLLIRISLCDSSAISPAEGCILGQRVLADYTLEYKPFFIPFRYPELFSPDSSYYFTLTIAAYSNEMEQDTSSFFVLDELKLEKTLTNIETSTLDITVRPIPFRDQVFISSLNNHEILSITFYNLQGIPVMHYKSPFQDELFLNTSPIPPGIYTILVRGDNAEFVSKKVVKY